MTIEMSYKTFDLSVCVDSEGNWKGRIKLDKKYEFTNDNLEGLEKKFHELVDEYLYTPRSKTQFSIVYKNSTLEVTPLIDGCYSAVCRGWIFPLYESLDDLFSKFQERVEEYIHSGYISIASATHLAIKEKLVMKILVMLGEDTFKLENISSKSYRDGSVHYTVKYNKEFLEKIVPEEELVETKDFEFIKGMRFVDGTDYYKIY